MEDQNESTPSENSDLKSCTSDQTAPTGDADSATPWVSTDVLAAQAGLRVQMGKTLEGETGPE